MTAILLREAAAAFLVAYVTVVGVVLGVLAMVMIAHLTTATWFGPLRRSAARILSSLPVLALLGVFVLLSLPVLYRWTSASTATHQYLNIPFFIARTVVYWIVWVALAELLAGAARMEARGEIARAARRYRRVSSAGLVALGLTMTFAAFDWMMSLDAAWSSTIYGVYWFAGGMVGALALIAIVARRDGAAVAPNVWPSLGKLLVTFVLFWLYIAFSQYIVVWSGDLPREVTWYVPRTRGAWGAVAWLLLLGMFVLPFLALIVRPIKRSGAALAAIGALLLVLHYVDTYWMVMPGFVPVTVWTVVLALVMLAVVAGAALLVARARTAA